MQQTREMNHSQVTRGNRVIVVGSAPDLVIPKLLPNDIIYAANGGIAYVSRCDYLFTTSYLFRKEHSQQENKTLRSMSNRHCTFLIIDLSYNVNALKRYHDSEGMNSTSSQRATMVPAVRSNIVTQILGTDIRVSTGLFAACFASRYGANSIVLCGINPLINGHKDMPEDFAIRDHGAEDLGAICLLKNKTPLYTTSDKLAKAANIHYEPTRNSV